MGDSLSIIFAMIVAVLLMFFFPMIDTWERQDDLSYVTAYTNVVNTVDAVRNTGVLTFDMYADLLTTINATGNSFDIKMEHREAVYIPDPAVEGSYKIVYRNYYTKQIMDDLRSNGYHEFKKLDYFYISVKNTNITQATVLKSKIYGTQLATFKVGVPYGGQIRNDASI